MLFYIPPFKHIAYPRQYLSVINPYFDGMCAVATLNLHDIKNQENPNLSS